MSGRSATEATPLLASEAPPSPAGGSSPATRQRAFKIATATSLVTAILSFIFLVASIILLGGAPSNYYPPYEIYYHFAPVAAFAAIASLHSTLVLLDGAPLSGTIAGILVDVFAGLYFLFSSLYGLQRLLGRPRYEYNGCREGYSPPIDIGECEKWRVRVEPVIWTYLLITLVLGLSHVILLFLRSATYKRGGGRELRVRLVDEDGNTVRR